MNPELAAYDVSLRDRLERIAQIVEGMSADQLNTRPPTADGNSAWVLATHVIGNMRAWIIGIIAGEDIRRDRPAEFASSGDDGRALAASLRGMQRVVTDKLGSLNPGRLELRMIPAQELWGEGAAREISGREAILHVIEHATLHLGHLQLTRDLTEAARE